MRELVDASAFQTAFSPIGAIVRWQGLARSCGGALGPQAKGTDRAGSLELGGRVNQNHLMLERRHVSETMPGGFV